MEAFTFNRSQNAKRTLKGHSPLSNFFLKPKTLMADSIVRFAVKARTNSLMMASLNSLSTTPPQGKHAIWDKKFIPNRIKLKIYPKSRKYVIQKYNTIEKVVCLFLSINVCFKICISDIIKECLILKKKI